jgi:hypothetical protein
MDGTTVNIIDPVACVPGMNDIPKVLSIPTLATLIWRETYAAGRIPARALAMVGVLTSPPASLVKSQVCHYNSVEHCMEALDLHVYLLAILIQQGCELIDDDPRGQSIVCRPGLNLLALPHDLADFFMECSRPISESVMACQTLPVELGVVPPGGGTILNFSLGRSRVILPASVSLPSRLVSFSV